MKAALHARGPTRLLLAPALAVLALLTGLAAGVPSADAAQRATTAASATAATGATTATTATSATAARRATTATSVSAVGDALRKSPVYVDPAARAQLSAAGAATLARQIKDADKPLFVAVLPAGYPTRNLFTDLRTATGITGLYAIRLGGCLRRPRGLRGPAPGRRAEPRDQRQG